MINENLKIATEIQAMKFFTEAQKFVNDNGFYGSYKSVAIAAVQEYIAYKAGYTVRS